MNIVPTLYYPKALEKSSKNKFMWRLLYYCLDWIRDEVAIAPVTIIVKPGQSHRIIWGDNLTTWIPEEVEPKVLKLYVSKFSMFEEPNKIKLKSLKKMLEKNLPECIIQWVKLENNIKVLKIIWPTDIEIKVVLDEKHTKERKSISPTYSILSVLKNKGEWITAGYSKNSFRNRVIIGFKDKVIYEGKDATYIFNENGLAYIQADNLKKVMKSPDFIGRVVHHDYEQWSHELELYLSK